MIRLLISLCLFIQMTYAETVLAEPKPSMENQRKIIFGISSRDEETIQHVLSVANNVLKFYGPENVEMEIVAYYHGIRALLAKEKAFAPRVDALMQYDVRFIACGNTMRTKKIDKSELIEDVEVVTAGVVEMIERVNEGFTYIKP